MFWALKPISPQSKAPGSTEVKGRIFFCFFMAEQSIAILITTGSIYPSVQGRQFVLKSGGDKRSDEKTLQQDGKNIE